MSLVSRRSFVGAWQHVAGDRDKTVTHRPVIRRTPQRRRILSLFLLPPVCAPQDHQTPASAALPSPRTMSEDHASKQRKAARSAITSTAPAKQLVRPRPGSPTREAQDDIRPAKRTRKAINCEPCRNSKLKCDRSVPVRPCGCLLILLYRNRPCSSCVLRRESLYLVELMVKTHPGGRICRDGRVVLSRHRWSTYPPR